MLTLELYTQNIVYVQLEIITPDKTVFSGKVSSANFPGTNGSFEVLTSHAALISTLSKGPIRFRSEKGDETVVVDGGLVEVLDDKIIVLAEAVLQA